MNFWDYLNSLNLPKGTDLALWWIGALGIAAVIRMNEPKDVLIPIVAGLTGFIGGRVSSPKSEMVQPEVKGK